MSVELAVWHMSNSGPVLLGSSALDSEERLETLLIDDPTMLGTELLIIGRQVPTSFGGRIDLLALDDEGRVHVLELKRDQTPRDTVAQVLDYGSWAANLGLQELQDIFDAHKLSTDRNPGEVSGAESLDAAFADQFGQALPDVVNADQQFTIVASKLDDASDRIVEFLAETYEVPINAVFFRHFAHNDNEYLARTWLLDQQVAENRPNRKVRSKSRPWNGRDYYAVLGSREDDKRWLLARRYGFLNGGSGKRYWKPLRHLERGHRVFAHVAGCGYVGVGEVTGEMRPIGEATVIVRGEEEALIEQPDIHSHFLNAAASEDEDAVEMVVPVKWMATRDFGEAFWEPGLFANQNTACKLTRQNTIDRVLAEFGLEDSE
ncbi:hypothetical protein [Candidatus Poriferisodalis sp.]|uniref:hypothetical protein n=1 Tax=Candidatus Poriferisodalis sp. TaxID=3101277 RepID=UPI003B01D65D